MSPMSCFNYETRPAPSATGTGRGHRLRDVRPPAFLHVLEFPDVEREAIRAADDATVACDVASYLQETPESGTNTIIIDIHSTGPDEWLTMRHFTETEREVREDTRAREQEQAHKAAQDVERARRESMFVSRPQAVVSWNRFGEPVWDRPE